MKGANYMTKKAYVKHYRRLYIEFMKSKGETVGFEHLQYVQEQLKLEYDKAKNSKE